MKRCPQCKGKTLQKTETKEESRVGGYQFTATLPVIHCASCGESFISGEILARFELCTAHKLAELGMREGAVCKFMRKALGLRAIDMAELLGVTPETISRWETNKTTIDLATFVTLGLLVADKLEGETTTRDWLRSALTPHKPKTKSIRVSISRAA